MVVVVVYQVEAAAAEAPAPVGETFGGAAVAVVHEALSAAALGPATIGVFKLFAVAACDGVGVEGGACGHGASLDVRAEAHRGE